MRISMIIGCLAFLVSGCGDGKKADRPMRESYPVLDETVPPLPEGHPLAAMVMVEFVEVGFEDFTQWSVDNPMGPEAGNLLRREAQGWIAQDRAWITETMAVYCGVGKTAKTTSVREYLYPSDYSYDSTMVGSDGEEDEGAEEKVDSDEETAGENGKEKPKKKKGSVVKTSPSPVAYEVRDSGVTLEVSVASIAADSGAIELRIHPNLVQRLGEVEWKAVAGNDLGDFTSPVFDVREISSTLSLQDGVYALLGIGNTPRGVKNDAEKETLLLAFVRADSNKRQIP